MLEPALESGPRCGTTHGAAVFWRGLPVQPSKRKCIGRIAATLLKQKACIMPTLANSATRTVHRRLQIALGVSLLLHVLALSKPGTFSRTEKGAAFERLEISLRAPQTTAPAPSQPQAASVPAVTPSAQALKVPRKAENPISAAPDR